METKITENDIKLIKHLVDYEPKVIKCQKYIKENFNIDSIFDEENLSIRLICNNINESLNLLAAKEYILNEIGEENITINF
ncbi:MAG: hypothetical protein J1F35_06380 [Erysipelotrichales bacterium]|nr:hypothetical protein [Erysipelotrichales bacterium]